MVIEEIIQNLKLNFFNKQNLAFPHSAASIHCTFKAEFLALAMFLLYDPCRKHDSWTLPKLVGTTAWSEEVVH